MRSYNTPTLTDHGNVIARTLGAVTTTTVEPAALGSGRSHKSGAPAGMTFEPIAQHSSTYALYSETAGVDPD
jgi:hypothetical protein